MRSIGIDIQRDFMEVAIAEGGEIRSGPRVAMDIESLELFAASLDRGDQVALEVSGNAWELVRILRPHVGRIVAVSPTDTGMRQARAKTDRLDARALARLLAAGQLESGLGPRRGDAGDAPAASAPKPARPHQIRGQERDPRGADEAARPEARLQRPLRRGRS